MYTGRRARDREGPKGLDRHESLKDIDAFALGSLQHLLIERRERRPCVFRCREAVGIGEADRVPLPESSRFDPDRLVRLVHSDAESRDRLSSSGEFRDIGRGRGQHLGQIDDADGLPGRSCRTAARAGLDAVDRDAGGCREWAVCFRLLSNRSSGELAVSLCAEGEDLRPGVIGRATRTIRSGSDPTYKVVDPWVCAPTPSVELVGIEPTTSAMPWRRSTS
jgi:hypothetical protein